MADGAQDTAVHKVDWNNANDLQDLAVYDLVIAADVVSDCIRNKRCHFYKGQYRCLIRITTQILQLPSCTASRTSSNRACRRT